MKIEQIGQRTSLADDTAEMGEASNDPLSLIVGLGNPGSEYADHRHNIGFQILQALAGMHRLSFTRHKKAKARVAEGQIRGRLALLAKPQTFMNLSGKSVRRLSHDYEIPPDRILVICDDLDLPLGRLRIRPKGGSGCGPPARPRPFGSQRAPIWLRPSLTGPGWPACPAARSPTARSSPR